MTYWRTARQTSGAQPSAGPRNGAGTHAELISFPSGTPLERREISKPSFDEGELGSGLFFLAVTLAPALFVAVVVFGYLAFIA